MVVFFKKGYCCVVKKNNHEPYDNFVSRGLFVVNQRPKSMEEYKDIINKSYIYINIKNGLIYGDSIMKSICELSTGI